MQPTPQVNTMSLKRCNADLIGAFTIKLNLRKIFIVWLVLISSIANLAQAKPNGYNTISVSFDYGRFAQSPYSSDVWHEYGTDKEKPRHVFQVINRDEWSIYLYDRNRKMDLQIDMHRMWISFGGQGSKKVDLYKIDYADSKKPITFGNSTIERGDTGESDGPIYYNQLIGIFSESQPVRLDIGRRAMKENVPASVISWATRLRIKRLDGPNKGKVFPHHVIGIFSETEPVRLDIGTRAMKEDVPASHNSRSTQLVFQRLDGPNRGPIRYGEVVGVFSSDRNFRLNIGRRATQENVPASHNSWGTRLQIIPQ